MSEGDGFKDWLGLAVFAAACVLGGLAICLPFLARHPIW